MASITACPNLSADAKTALAEELEEQQPTRGTVYEQALICLRPKIAALDFAKTAVTFGAESYRPGHHGAVLFGGHIPYHQRTYP